MKWKDKFFEVYTEAKIYGDVSRYYIAIPTFILVLVNHVQTSDYALWIDILIYFLIPILFMSNSTLLN